MRVSSLRSPVRCFCRSAALSPRMWRWSQAGADWGLPVMAGNLGCRERNPAGRGPASRHPQVGDRGPAGSIREFDPVSRERVPLAGHPVSTGAACPWESWSVGGRCRPNARRYRLPGWGPGSVERRKFREQAYVSAEQPTPAQGARFPPAHAHPCRPGRPFQPPPQGPQEPRRLRRGSSALPVLPIGATVVPAAHRLTEPDAFRRASRQGRRSASRTVVTHLWTPGGDEPPRVGFVVSRAVGNAVVRNRVKRRLRHLVREHLASLPGSAVLVVRSLPAAAAASSSELGADLVRCLDRAGRS
jgi:ribonuclease P protein component